MPRLKVAVPLAAVIILAWVFRSALREEIRDSTTLANDSPTPELVLDMINSAADPHAALLAAWCSGKIIQREVAVDELGRIFPVNQPLPPEFESLLRSAAVDADMNVRETALRVLQNRNDPALTTLAAAQLGNADPELRLLGVNYFRHVPAAVGVPLAAGLLDDPDLRVAGLSAKLLENWSGENFNIKLADTVLVENKTTGLEEFQGDGLARARAAMEKAKSWWRQHEGEYPAVHPDVPTEARAGHQPMTAGDFELHTLDGRNFRLSDYRGKVVLINFWTTWCTACVGEMPELIALQKKHMDDLVIVGVSLDSVPDEDGDAGGDGAGQKPQKDPESAGVLLEKIRDKVARAVSARGINYPVLLDEHYEVGGRFNGGELPTTVIVDAQGNIRRRFVGPRSLPVFEAMISEAGEPAQLTALPLSAKK